MTRRTKAIGLLAPTESFFDNLSNSGSPFVVIVKSGHLAWLKTI